MEMGEMIEVVMVWVGGVIVVVSGRSGMKGGKS